MHIPGSKAVYVSLVILGLLATGVNWAAKNLPGWGFAFDAPTVASEPYALDDPVKRSRVDDGSVSARFPERLAFAPRDNGISSAVVNLDVEPGEPGFNSELHVYRPAGSHAAGSLGCVLVGPAGGAMAAGPVTSDRLDEDEWLPYVEAGFAVVAFRQDGERPRENTTKAENIQAAREFFAAQAGLVNARNALEFVLARMPEVDPKRIYVAGHSSAATLALLFAEHESRLAGCIAYAPVTNVAQRLEDLALVNDFKVAETARQIVGGLLTQVSPSTHAAKITCPLFLFHGLQDRIVPVAESQALAARLEQLGKPLQFATVDGWDHHGDMIGQGIPLALEWLEDLEHPELAEQRKPQRAAAQAARAAPAENQRAQLVNGLLAGSCASWIEAAQNARDQLVQVVDESVLDNRTIARLDAALSRLAERARAVFKCRGFALQDKQVPIHGLPVETRDKLVALNLALADELERLRGLNAPALKRGTLLLNFERGLLSESFLEGRFPSPAELVAEHQRETEYQAARFAAAGQVRDFRADARWAMTFRRWQEALKLLRADLLVGDDALLAASVKWSPALARPAAHLQWAFGAQIEGIPGAGPANLWPPAATAKAGNRATGADRNLGRQLKWLTGDIGLWLAEGLQNRVVAGSFGDWAQDEYRSAFDHPGIVLLNFAPVDTLLVQAAALHADVLMAVLLNHSARDTRSVTRMSVQVYDVERGALLWESKPITNTQIQSARRRGDSADAKFTEAVLAHIDEAIALRDAADLDEATIRKRLAALSAGPPAEPLEALIELRYYQLKKLIADQAAQDQITEILGAENARRLVSDDQVERRGAIEKLVPKRH